MPIHTMRKEAKNLLSVVSGKINSLNTDDSLNDAREKALSSGILKPNQKFANNATVDDKKKYLINSANPGDDKMRIDALRNFAILL